MALNEDILNPYYFIDDYTKFGLTYCTKSYGRYSSIGEAKVACDLDSGCKGLYDYNCDRTGVYLCPNGGEYGSSSFSCTYRKGNISHFVAKLETKHN